jgi:hypothetical protein
MEHKASFCFWEAHQQKKLTDKDDHHNSITAETPVSANRTTGGDQRQLMTTTAVSFWNFSVAHLQTAQVSKLPTRLERHLILCRFLCRTPWRLNAASSSFEHDPNASDGISAGTSKLRMLFGTWKDFDCVKTETKRLVLDRQKQTVLFVGTYFNIDSDDSQNYEITNFTAFPFKIFIFIKLSEPWKQVGMPTLRLICCCYDVRPGCLDFPQFYQKQSQMVLFNPLNSHFTKGGWGTILSLRLNLERWIWWPWFMSNVNDWLHSTKQASPINLEQRIRWG